METGVWGGGGAQDIGEQKGVDKAAERGTEG
jgi:hypothetical protein